MTYLLRRAPRELALSALATHSGQRLDDVAAALPDLAMAWDEAPLGGTPVPESALHELREAMVAVAAELGYPDSSPNTRERSAFDAAAGELLHQRLPMTPNEAASESVWNYLTAAWLIDLCAWRWGWDADKRRFTGDPDRGQFRRLWWREEVLGAAGGGGTLVPRLGETEFFEVMERPTLTRERRVARMLVTVYLIAQTNLGGFKTVGLGRENVMRSFARRVLRLTPFTAIEFLDDEQLHDLLVGVLCDAINSQIKDGVPVGFATISGRPAA
jgi:hypothetical protein